MPITQEEIDALSGDGPQNIKELILENPNIILENPNPKDRGFFMSAKPRAVKPKGATSMFSRYEGNNVSRTAKEGFTHYTLWTMPPLPITIRDIKFTVTSKYENRIDLIAFDFYQEPNLWWAIMLRNGLDDPTYIPLGTVLYITPKDTIISHLLNYRILPPI